MRARTLCVWFPMWSLTRPDAPPDEPLLVVDDRVTGATVEVLEAGVALGMPRREAEVLAPFATVLERDVAEEARRFEVVVELVEDLVPRVEVVSPGLLYVPVDGAVRFYGGEEALAERMVEATGAGIEIESSTDRRDLLEGADFVIQTIAVGGREAWEVGSTSSRRCASRPGTRAPRGFACSRRKDFCQHPLRRRAGRPSGACAASVITLRKQDFTGLLTSRMRIG